MKFSKTLGLSVAIGLALILTACSATATATPAPAPAVTLPPTQDLSPTALPSAQSPAQPTETMAQPTVAAAPTEAVVTPTASASTSAPDCASPAPLTPAQTEGPYYTPNSPEKTSLIEPGMSGTKLIVTGYVLTKDCQPVAKALLDFWQADAQGAYDNAGYRLRGHLFTDEQGRYTLETIVPGEYPGRTQHIHVKVQAPGGPLLTTQLYFPGAAGNDRDSIFNPALLADVTDTAAGKVATFNFVVDTP